VSLFDEIAVEPGDGQTTIECDWPHLPEDNTLSRTLRLCSEIVEIPPLRITLRKRIPPQSGLGGGSSNAAGLLRVLGHFHPVLKQGTVLPDISRAVGADVPFFLLGGRAKGEGYGDALTPLPELPTKWYVLAKPEIGCDTRAAYARLDESPLPFREFATDDELYNDFERVAPMESLELKKALLQAGAFRALLCGSGSAVFGEFDSEGEAQMAARKLFEGGAEFAEAVRSLTADESVRLETYEG
jgi:4-diphosphocytidyl-2-C-methyl-D-erythritol kinase